MISHSQNLRTLDHELAGGFDPEHYCIVADSQQTALDAVRIAKQDGVRPVARHTLQVEPAVIRFRRTQYRDSQGNHRKKK